MTPKEKQKLADALGDRVGEERRHLCPICGVDDWTMADELSTLSLQSTPGALVLGGPAIPVAIVVCRRCGFCALHSSRVLADLPDEPTKSVHIRA